MRTLVMITVLAFAAPVFAKKSKASFEKESEKIQCQTKEAYEANASQYEASIAKAFAQYKAELATISKDVGTSANEMNKESYELSLDYSARADQARQLFLENNEEIAADYVARMNDNCVAYTGKTCQWEN
jgi:ABC-type Zn uptake system ZnuABC Zn-binding protein ZnuA